MDALHGMWDLMCWKKAGRGEVAECLEVLLPMIKKTSKHLNVDGKIVLRWVGSYIAVSSLKCMW